MVNRALAKKSNITLFNFLKLNIVFLAFVLFFFCKVTSFADLNTDISISGIVINNGNRGGGDNTSGNGYIITNSGTKTVNNEILPTDITFSGVAYPNSRVTLLSGGIEVLETKADSNAFFSLKLSSLSAGVKIFSVVAQDREGIRSVLLTIPISIEDNTSTTVSKLFIPPTLFLDKTLYGRGEDILAHGYSVPDSKILLNIDSKNNINTTADITGFYNADIKTDSFLLGYHTIQVKSQTTVNDINRESGLGQIVSFVTALNKNTKIQDQSDITVVADINNDGVIDIKDFSVLAFWFSKAQVPKNIDLNGDGKITMADFSILAYYWNG